MDAGAFERNDRGAARGRLSVWAEAIVEEGSECLGVEGGRGHDESERGPLATHLWGAQGALTRASQDVFEDGSRGTHKALEKHSRR